MSETDTAKKYTQETVTAVHAWDAPGLVSVRVTRAPTFDFVPGQFARIGLKADEIKTDPKQAVQTQAEPSLWRAYSMVTHPSENALEFLSVTVPEGEFSPKFARLKVGDPLWVEKTPFGFLTLERFEPARSLWLVATGTGLSAYLSMLAEKTTWANFDAVVLVHGVRTERELAYRNTIEAIGKRQPKLRYVPVLSRQPWSDGKTPPQRITQALQTGLLERISGQSLEPDSARIMLCGNPQMVTEMRAILSDRGFAASRRGNPGTLAVENYW